MIGFTKERFLQKQKLAFFSPNYSEERGACHLLVWRDIPHWSVVDDELFAFLHSLDGTSTLGDVMDSKPEWKSAKKAILPIVRTFYDKGLLRAPGQAGPELSPRPETRIENVAINVTQPCNLRCGFCYNLGHLSDASAEEISASEAIAFLDGIADVLGTSPSLSLLGGEPLRAINKTLALARYGMEKGFNTIVSTNGTLLTPEFAAEAAAVDLQVQVSMEGATAEENDSLRGFGTFGKVLDGIKCLIDNGVYTIISEVAHQDNVRRLKSFYSHALSLGVDEARFIPLKRIGAARESGLCPPDMVQLASEAARVFRENPEFRKLTGRDAFSIMATTCKYSFRRASCGTGLQTLLLDANGDIFPCLNTNSKELLVGNIRDPGFEFSALWEESPVLQKVRLETAVDEASNACCQCPVKYWCLGGCRGETFNVKGRLAENAWNCAEQKRTILDMFWTLSQEPDLVRRAGKFELL